MLDSSLTYPVVEVVLVALLASAVGVHVVLRRRAFFTMAMTHATFPGVVLASMLGLNLYLGGGLFGLLVVAGIAALDRRRDQDSTATTGVVLSAGFALGVLLVSTQPGFTRDLSGYLVGSILTVQASDVVITSVICVAVLGTLAATGRVLLFAAFDPLGATAAGYRVGLLDAVFLVVVELTVVTSVPAVGTMLAVALIVGPAAAARLWTTSTLTMTLSAAVIGVGSGLTGLLLSEYVRVPAGAAITLIATGALGVSLLAAGARRVLGRPRPAATVER
ncbi:MAG: iron chelate uptake ABC transporter family permease subunit [Streptosporangiales bacterium]|nr:iron chelate uptake ABC transporter family permease subunit [Streptosporangiales bacterium]